VAWWFIFCCDTGDRVTVMAGGEATIPTKFSNWRLYTYVRNILGQWLLSMPARARRLSRGRQRVARTF
jgi:hypothetical protein